MTKGKSTCAAMALLAFLSIGTPAFAESQLATVIVHVTGAHPASGTAEISLFNSAEGFMKEPFLQRAVAVPEDGNPTVEFAGVPAGEYAIVVVHDENDNGKLDSGFLGFGGESYAWFRSAHPLFGWPDFDDVKFEVTEDMEIEVSLD